VEWLGDLPEHWEVKRLKYVSSYCTSNVDKKTQDDQLPVRLCNYTDVYYQERIRVNDSDYMEATASPHEVAKFKLDVGDVVITKDSEDWTDIAIPALVEETADDFVCGYHLGIIRTKPLIDSTFIFRAVQSVSINRQLQVYASGVTRYGLPKTAIGEALIPFPTLPEQLAIAGFLDQETARVDALVEKKKQLIERLAEYRTALITRTVTRGLPPDVAEAEGFDPAPPLKPSGVEWLGDVPEHWEVKQLHRICQLAYGDSLPDDSRQTGEFPVLGSNGTVGYHKKTNTLAPVIVIGRKGSHGRVNFNDSPIFAIDTTFFIDGRNTDAELRWLYFSLLCIELDEESMDSAVPGLSRQYAYKKDLALPPLKEQRAIAAFLDSQTECIDALSGQVEAAIERLQEYRTALITAAVTGKIDVSNWERVETGASA